MRTGERSLVDRLQKTRLLSSAEWTQARALLSDGGARAEISGVNRLVELGLLTAWQGLQLLEGRTSFFIGPYKLLQRIGQGGAASVYKAQHSRMGQIVALKVFPRSLLQLPDAAARFRRETQASVRVNHPHVVAGYGSKCFDGRGVLIMEFVAGDDLTRWLKRCGTLPVDWCCEVVRQAAAGLAHIHQRGLVHRDVKPSNILASGASLQELPHVKVADLGAANIKFSDALTSTRITVLGGLLGTPNYIAPEQIDDGHAADHRADIFSLGCTLFKLLTNDLPWTGQNLQERLAARRNHAPRLVGELRDEIPPGLEQIIQTMLARDPAQRFGSAEEVARELTEFAGRWVAEAPGPSLPAAATPTAQPEAAPVAAAESGTAPRETAPKSVEALTQFAAAWKVRSDQVGSETDQADSGPQVDITAQAAAQHAELPPAILRIDGRDPRTFVIPTGGQGASDAPTRQWRLLRVSVQGAAEAYLLHEQDTVILGRARDCHIRVRDVQVSRHHCRLTWQSSGWRLEDLGSVNGTHVNGQSVTSCELRNGDQIRIGSTRFWLVATSDVDTAASRQSPAASGHAGPATA
ncbi:MAG TPA: FHA domain-containing serine/threonine-protein kinase [Pirellulales bacterium]|nr:FHA domain-containing serine/threonine-protein kinase [Pirellulales bacterium]